jgi:hypothetical protein
MGWKSAQLLCRKFHPAHPPKHVVDTSDGDHDASHI